MISATSRRAFIGCQTLVVLLVAVSCSMERDAVREVQPGQTRAEVRATAGDPDEIIEFTIPTEPFFGPQEGLASLLPAGTRVEEWQYQNLGEVIYIWFAGGAADSREDWRVIETAVFPADAVF